MSGLEVAGVVLGGIPIVISAPEHYAEGVRSIKELGHYRWELEKVVTKLKTEKAILGNTHELLLEGIAGPSEMEELLQRLTKPGSNPLKDSDLGNRLDTRLWKNKDIYSQNLRIMNKALESMKERLDLDANGKVGSVVIFYDFQISKLQAIFNVPLEETTPR